MIGRNISSASRRSLIKVFSPAVLRLQHGLYSQPKCRLLVLYLHADSRRYPDSFEKLRVLLRLCGESFIVKIDNFATHPDRKIISPDTVGIAGDNSFWEFSGWRKGLDYARQNLPQDFTHVLFVNDAFLNKASQGFDLTYYRRLFNQITLSKVGDDVLGDVSSAPGNHLLRGRPINRWIKSSIYCLSYANALRLPLNNLNDELLNELIPPVYRPGPLLNAHPLVNDEFRTFLEEWLTRRWQWKLPANAENWPLLRGKAAAIINERLLTDDMKQLGCRLLEAQPGVIAFGAKGIAPASLSSGQSQQKVS